MRYIAWKVMIRAKRALADSVLLPRYLSRALSEMSKMKILVEKERGLSSTGVPVSLM